MIKIYYLICFLTAFSCSSGPVKYEKAIKLKKVPSQVVEAFYMKHPEVKASFHKHEMNDDVTFEANYVVGDKEHSERFTKEGILIESEEEIDFESVSLPIKTKLTTFLVQQDEKYKLNEAQKVHSKEFKGFELKVRTNRSQTGLMEYFFNSDGSFHHQEELELKSIPTLY